MRRQKRKPDSIQLNFVESLPKRRSVQIRRVTYSLSPSAPQEAARSGIEAGTSSSTACSGSGYDSLQDDFHLQEHLLGCESLLDPVNSSQYDSHTKRKEKAAEAWAEIRSKLVPAMISTLGFPNETACVFCKCSNASVWCKDCGALAYLCEQCTRRLHTNINLFHSPLLWKVRLIPIPHVACSK